MNQTNELNSFLFLPQKKMEDLQEWDEIWNIFKQKWYDDRTNPDLLNLFTCSDAIPPISHSVNPINIIMQKKAMKCVNSLTFGLVMMLALVLPGSFVADLGPSPGCVSEGIRRKICANSIMQIFFAVATLSMEQLKKVLEMLCLLCQAGFEVSAEAWRKEVCVYVNAQ